MSKSASDTIKVFLRVKPYNAPGGVAVKRGGEYVQNHEIIRQFDHTDIKFHWARVNADEIGPNHTNEFFNFRFSNVFDMNASQEEIFNNVAKDSVLSVLQGYNSTVFAYGQTGSGKTYTMTGGTTYVERGIIPRALSLLYEEINKQQGTTEYTVRVSYLQIYNEKGQDLLNRGKDAKTFDDLPRVTVAENDEEFFLRGLESHASPTMHEALNWLLLGDTNRIYTETEMNQTSSRSHCIFTVSLEARVQGSAAVRRSKLHLVDLAGSERVGKTHVEGRVLTEAKHINLSLHYLEQVITALAQKEDGKRPHVPYRNSFMTMVLRDSLGGNSRTSMIATCYPHDDFMGETVSTCRFAQRVSCIRQNATVNEETDPYLLIRKLKAEISGLREELARYRSPDQAGDRNLDASETERCREVVQRFLQNQDPNATMDGLGGDMARIRCCFQIMKAAVLGKPLPSIAPAAGGVTSDQSSTTVAVMSSALQQELEEQIKTLQMSLQEKEAELNVLFSIVQKAKSGGAGAGASMEAFHSVIQSKALPPIPSNTPPPMVGGPVSPVLYNDNASMGDAGGVTRDVRLPSITAPRQPAAAEQIRVPQTPPEPEAIQRLHGTYDLAAVNADAELLKDRTQAFEAFRKSYRKHEQIERSKEDLKQCYDIAKSLAAKINTHSDRVRQIKHRIMQIRAECAVQGVKSVDPEETALLAELETEKKLYQGAAAELGQQKEKIDHMHMLMQKTQQQMLKDFESWFTVRQQQLQLCQIKAMASGAPITPPGPTAINVVAASQQPARLSSFVQRQHDQVQLQHQQHERTYNEINNSSMAHYQDSQPRRVMTGPTMTQPQPQPQPQQHAMTPPTTSSNNNSNDAAVEAELQRVHKAREEMRRRLSQGM
eukprot:PhF_6_TR36521/c0_g1_i1/m.53806/K10397/KIF6_9; kinesin family member 6/9